eukprot:TRINITY_DN38_c0_g1_i4.p3 TRINITY_DN38_c0_g1~~TRINITY_DN38_c0_g1_i4.p3  ORF type:complete len:189 (+),score=28.77 TRINITY_DN38_c0_g1_i4:765-1331(+)
MGSKEASPATPTPMTVKMLPPASTLSRRFLREGDTPGEAASAISGRTAAATSASEVGVRRCCTACLLSLPSALIVTRAALRAALFVGATASDNPPKAEAEAPLRSGRTAAVDVNAAAEADVVAASDAVAMADERGRRGGGRRSKKEGRRRPKSVGSARNGEGAQEARVRRGACAACWRASDRRPPTNS